MRQSTVVEPPLLERELELAAIRTAVNAAEGGRGSVMWIEGAAGIGKTRLLRAAREYAHRAGVRVLCARPGPLEREFAFGVVCGLFEPAVTAQPAVLATGPAKLAAPVVTLAEPSGRPAVTAERLHGLYWLMVALTDEAPLLLILDDAHWADEPSLQALAYLARRVEELPVAILLGVRSDLAADVPDTIRNDQTTVVLRPGPLTRAASNRLIHAVVGDATSTFLSACHDAARGNPLLLTTLLAALHEDGVPPDDSGLDAVRRRAQTIVATFVLARLRHLTPQAGALARAIAVLGRDAQLRQAAALAELAPDTALDDAAVLVEAELLAPGRPLSFTHPLIAEAVTAHMSVAERHRGHLRAARCLATHNADPERVAAHLLAVEPLADQWVVARLREAAQAALGKGAPGATVTYLHRAIAEPVEPTDLPELLVELGTAQISAGDGAGFRTLRQAVDLESDPPAAARVALAVSRAARNGGNYQSAEDTVIAVATVIGDTDPELLADLHTELAIANRIGTAPGYPTTARVGELADRAAARGDDTTSLLLRLATLTALHDPATGPAAGSLATRAAASLSSAKFPDIAALFMTSVILSATERLDTALAAVDTVLDTAGQNGQLFDLLIVTVATTVRAQINYRLGRLWEAEEDARLADRLGAGYKPEHRRHMQTWLLHCLIERGLLDDAENELANSSVPVTLAQLLMARAQLRLAQQRPADALADLDECGRRLARRQVLHPNHLHWQPWSIVALLRLGREDEARARAAAALSAAREFGSARAEGLALWASGLVERSPDLLTEAVTVLQQVPAPLERARALIDLGAALRRANRRADARAPLEEGLQLAHDRGADALVETAMVELAATGVHLRRPAVTGPDALTPTERRIAEQAAGGASNRDIAQALFITPKTVENHLGNAYRKLGVTGRGELADALDLGSGRRSRVVMRA
jgi:DNA-binding CsgD family transcriptional regulator